MLKISILFIFLSVISFSSDDFKKFEEETFIILSQKEKNFLKNTKIKAITSTTWAPMNMLNDDSELSGIAVDFWKLIKKHSNLKSKYVVAENWNTVLYKIKNREADITLGTSYGKDKSQYAKFSVPYISFPIAFATLLDKHFIPDASFLDNKKVAVGANYSTYTVLNEAYPKINFVQVKNTKEALELLSAGEVYAAVDILPVIAHLISKNGYYNLKVAGTSKHTIDISFMVRDDYPELLSILNKYIQMLTQDEKNLIVREWLTVKFDKRLVDYTTLIQILVAILIMAAFLIFRQLELRKYNKKLQKLSTTDELTGIYNRRKLNQILNANLVNAYSIILVDIDHFKFINDVNSHFVGDRVLRDFSKILLKNMKTNQYVGRWAGEEFLIFLPNTSIIEAKSIAENLRIQIESNEFDIDMVTASFGISQSNLKTSVNDVLTQADNALSRAKKSGRNQVICI